MRQGSGQLETWLGEVSFPPCLPWGSAWNPPHGKKARTGAYTTVAQRLPAAAPTLLVQRPWHEGGFGAGSAGRCGKAGQHGGSSLPSSSTLLGFCAFSLWGRSGAGRPPCNLQGKQPRPPAPGPWQSWAGPSDGEARSGSTGALVAFSKQNPWIPHSICKSCQKLRHSTGTAGCLFPTTTPLAAVGGYHFGEVPQHLAAPWWKVTEAQLCLSSNSLHSRGPSAIDFYPFSPAVVYKVGLAWAVCARARFILSEHGCAWH